VKYWDASAIVPLLLAEASSVALRHELASDQAMVSWWGTRIECMSALARYAREQRFTAVEVAAGRRRLIALAEEWTEIQPDEALRASAERIISVHSLRAADALQLAAALVACDGRADNLIFVCLDTRLREAAVREGLRVSPDTVPRTTAVRERAAPRRKAHRAQNDRV
jgi:predicted nucleic acid-binding protein